MDSIPPSNDWAWVAQTQYLIEELQALVRRRFGRVVAITVSAPPEVPFEPFCQMIRSGLATQGVEDCELLLRPALGPMRVVSIEIEP